MYLINGETTHILKTAELLSGYRENNSLVNLTVSVLFLVSYSPTPVASNYRAVLFSMPKLRVKKPTHIYRKSVWEKTMSNAPDPSQFISIYRHRTPL